MRMKALFAVLAALGFLLSACSTPGAESREERKIRKRCKEIVSMYRDLYDAAPKQEAENQWVDQTLPQESIDGIEKCLLDKGLDILDSSEDCPDYFVNAEHFHQFWKAASNLSGIKCCRKQSMGFLSVNRD